MGKKMSIIVVLTAFVMMLSGCAGSVNLNKYLNPKVSGYDGYGSLRFETGNEMYGTDITFSSEAKSNRHLKNGDRIKVTAKMNLSLPGFIQKYECVPETTEKEYVVVGLEELTELDPFEYVELGYSGVSGMANVSVNLKNREKTAGIQFELDRKYNVSNGEALTVTAKYNSEYLAENYGVYVVKEQETVTVEGLSEYVNTIRQLPEDTEKLMKEKLENYMEAYVAKNWTKVSKFDGMDCIGTYVLRSEETSGWGANNYVGFVYCINVSQTKGQKKTNYYWYGEFDNVLLHSDGTAEVDYTGYKVPTGSVFFGSVYGEAVILPWTSEEGHELYVNGYETILELKTDQIVARKDTYTVEDNVSEE